MPLPRFRIRTLMIAVAVVAVAIAFVIIRELMDTIVAFVWALCIGLAGWMRAHTK
ncbi:MAG: hypothetical protein P4L84_19585 [Isosphaeraceae bacterium]|nr:hypothetical protein [Isosphaeraceae bacterium]